MLTCYDFSFSKLLTDAGSLDYLLVGDSLGMVLYGDSGTQFVKESEICRHIQAVYRGREASSAGIKPKIIGDMVFGTYENVPDSLASAKKLQEAGADIVKLEGPKLAEVAALREAGFSVCAHIGLTPQTIHQFKLQGKSEDEAKRLQKEALDLQEAGAEMIVLEMLPASLAKSITENLRIPTVGIGAGPHCSGQVLVLYDLLGMNPDFRPKFLKTYEDLASRVKAAATNYASEVRNHDFPSKDYYYS